MSYQLDRRDCQVASGSSNHVFKQQVQNDLVDVDFIGIKNISLVLPPTLRCASTVYPVLSRVLWEKNLRHITVVGVV